MNARGESVERFGEVVASGGGRARIRLEPASACGQCGSRGSCASAQAGEQIVELAVPATARVGERVCVSSSASAFVIASPLGYLLPAFGLMFGAIVAELVVGGDVATVIGAIGGLCLALGGARLLARFFLGCRVLPAVSVPGAADLFHSGESS